MNAKLNKLGNHIQSDWGGGAWSAALVWVVRKAFWRIIWEPRPAEQEGWVRGKGVMEEGQALGQGYSF